MGRVKRMKNTSPNKAKCLQFKAPWSREGYYELSLGQHVIAPGASRGVIKGFRLIGSSTAEPLSPIDCTVLIEDELGEITIHIAADLDPLPFREAA